MKKKILALALSLTFLSSGCAFNNDWYNDSDITPINDRCIVVETYERDAWDNDTRGHEVKTYCEEEVAK